jgi:cytidylate kinase
MAFNIALDGPAGAGKSSVAKEVSQRLGMDCLDTGAMYRAMGLYMLNNGIDPEDGEQVAAACDGVEIDVEYVDGEQRTLLMGEDVSQTIREERCSAASSAVSKVPRVRERLVALQRKIAGRRRMLMDGRDIGTTVLPDAQVKIYLTAAAEERARRRVKQLEKDNVAADYDTVLKNIIARDEQDMNRAVSPLRKADDAIEIDSTHMTMDEVIDRIVAIAREADV